MREIWFALVALLSLAGIDPAAAQTPAKPAANAASLLASTPQTVTGFDAQLYSRVLPPGMSQVTAMMAQHPKVVSVELGAKTIAVNNRTAATPFGTIDTPAQGGTVSGSAYVNFGWAIAPGGVIPADGSTITVLVDGVTHGHQQPVGGGVQDQAHLVGERLAATGAVGG